MTNRYLKNAKQNYLIATAVENDLWVKNVGPWVDERGVERPNKWEKCSRSDPDAVPDLNSAIILSEG